MRIVLIGAIFTISLLAMPMTAYTQDILGATKINVSPSILEAKNGDGPTLGLEYDFLKSIVVYDRPAADPLNPSSFAKIAVDIAASGTVAMNAERNPKNFLDFTGAVKSVYWNSNSGTFIGSGRVKYETDQSFDNKQGVFGVLGTYAKADLFAKNDSFAFQVGYSRVDPKEDKERKAALLANPLLKYNRWESEALYMLPTNIEVAPMIELNFRYYAERNAPLEVRRAELAIFRLATVRISLKNDFFIAYSYGKLPFDRTKDRIVQAGWSYKLR